MEATNGQGGMPTPIQLPIIPLNGVPLQLIKDQLGEPVMLIGPVVLALPIGGEEARKAIVDALTGITIAKPGDM